MWKWYESPKYLTLKGWGEWRTKTKKAHPVQYFIRENVPDWWACINIRIMMAKWAVLHRIIPKYRYHVIKPQSLKPGYHDPCTQIRAAAFDVMSEYADGLKGDGIKGTKWKKEDLELFPEEDGQRKIILEQIEIESKIVTLRDWWIDCRPHRDATTDELIMSIDISSGDKLNYEKYEKLVADSELEDEQKFIELVKLLPHMWY